MPPYRLLAMLAMALLAAGCGARPEPVGSRAEQWPVTVADASGSPVAVSGPPARVVTLVPGAAATLKALGQENVVELPAKSTGAAVLARKPSLVVVGVEQTPQTVAALQKTLGDVPIFRYGAPDFATLPRVVAQLGLAVGRGPEGVRVAERLARQLSDVRTRVTEAGTAKTMIDAGNLRALGSDTAAGRLLAAAGAVPVVPTTRDVRISDLQAAAPTAWVTIPGAPTTLRSLRQNAATRGIPAVRDGRFFTFDPASIQVGTDLPAQLDHLIDELHAPANAAA